MICGSVYFMYGVDDLFKGGSGSKNHGYCIVVVAAESLQHGCIRFDRERTGLCRGEIEIGTIKKHLRVSNTIASQLEVGNRGGGDATRAVVAMSVVVMP